MRARLHDLGLNLFFGPDFDLEVALGGESLQVVALAHDQGR